MFNKNIKLIIAGLLAVWAIYEFIQLQEEVLQQIDAQLREGTAVAADYITQSAAVRQAQLQVEQYRLQKQQLYIQLLTLKGIL